MKKKIITLCLVIAMLSVAVIGGTLAYFTDVDQATNEFTVGKLDIDLYENTAHTDAVGNPKQEPGVNLGKGTEALTGYKYEAVMPGDILTKKVTVVNEESEDVYMALSVVQNNYGIGKMTAEDNWFNQRVDNYFEGTKGFDHNQMQSLTSRTFTGSGWGTLSYTKIKEGQPNSATYTITDAEGNEQTFTVNAESNMRYYPTTIDVDKQDGDKSYVGKKAEGAKIIAIDYAVANQGEHNGNMMQNGADGKNVYDEMEAGCRIWVYYLYLPAGASMEFDFTVSVPVEIDEYSIEAFQNMQLDVRAAAIQVSGFKSAYDAFVALEDVYSFGYTEAHDPN